MNAWETESVLLTLKHLLKVGQPAEGWGGQTPASYYSTCPSQRFLNPGVEIMMPFQRVDVRMRFEQCTRNTFCVSWLIAVPFHFPLKWKKNDHFKSKLISVVSSCLYLDKLRNLGRHRCLSKALL